MSRTADIMTRVRDALSDPRKERYSDERLYRLIDEAQAAIARYARVLRKDIYLPVYPNVANYVMPGDCYLITRVEFEHKPLTFKSFEEMDAAEPDWQTTIGLQPTTVVYNKQTPGRFKLYPLTAYTPSNYGLVPTIDVPQFGTLYGQKVGLSLILSTFVNGAQVQSSIAENAGLLQTITDNAYIHVKYVYRPEKITTLVEPEVPEMFDKAIKHYVVGTALRDDRETQNRTIGNEEIQIFFEEVQLARREGMTNTVAVDTQYTTTYNTGF